MHEDIEAHEHGVVVRLLMMVAVTTVISSLSVVGAFVQPDGQVAGTVRDTAGSRLPGVAVDLTSSASGETVQSIKTDANGQYRIRTTRTLRVELSLGSNVFQR